MFQRFNTDTLVTRFIKNLLSKTDIPLLRVAQDGDIVVEGCVYLYKDVIIKCVSTGRIYLNPDDVLYPREDLYPSLILFPGTTVEYRLPDGTTLKPGKGGEAIATFKVIDNYVSTDKRHAYRYLSSCNYYDSRTHEHLGQYLRYLDAHGIRHLLPYYNCNSNTSATNIHIESTSHLSQAVLLDKSVSDLITESTSKYKVLSVPIRFNTNYTIAIDCNSEFILRPVIMSDYGLMKVPLSLQQPSSQSYNVDSQFTHLEYFANCSDLKQAKLEKAASQFTQPFLYSVQTVDPLLHQRESNLRLLIQIPYDNNSSVVVLEGNYVSNTGKKITTVTCNENGVVNFEDHVDFKLSLLEMNTHDSFAFSDRLVEYLFLNIVDIAEELTGNIRRTQAAISKLDPNYHQMLASQQVTRGVWDDKLTDAVIRYLQSKDDYYLRDMDGAINRDVEELFYRDGVTIDGSVS